MPRHTTVDVPEWSTQVRVRGLSGSDRDELGRFGDDLRTAWIVVRCVVDDHGERVFSDDDEGRVGEKSTVALRRVSDAILDLSGLTEASRKRITDGLDPQRKFLFRLAGHLHMTVEEMLARISSRELTEWAVYEDETGPLDAGYRADVLAGIVSATVANALKGKKGKRLKPSDFMPDWGRRRTNSPNQMATMLKSLTRRFGGSIRKRSEE